MLFLAFNVGIRFAPLSFAAQYVTGAVAKGCASALTGEVNVNFIEGLLGISPDGGSGVIEFSLFVLPLILIVFRAWQRSSRKRQANRT